MDKLRVGMAGFGWFGRKHLSAWNEINNAEVVGVADVNIAAITKSKEKSKQSEFHAADEEYFEINFPTYKTVEELIKNEKLDVLDIVVDEKNHFQVAKYALMNNVNIIVEKPFVIEYKHAMELGKLAKSKNLDIYVGHVLRFDKRAQYIKSQIEKGDLGEIRYLSFKRNFQPSAHLVYGRINPFYGAMVHDIDLALWFTKKRVKEVYGKVKYLLKRSNPDVLVALLEFEKDILCRIENIWHVSKTCPYGFENEIAVYGSKATSIQHNTPIVEIWGETKVECPEFFLWPAVMGKRSGALKDMLEHYAECISKDKKSPLISLDEVIETVRIAEILAKQTKSY